MCKIFIWTKLGQEQEKWFALTFLRLLENEQQQEESLLWEQIKQTLYGFVGGRLHLACWKTATFWQTWANLTVLCTLCKVINENLHNMSVFPTYNTIEADANHGVASFSGSGSGL